VRCTRFAYLAPAYQGIDKDIPILDRQYFARGARLPIKEPPRAAHSRPVMTVLIIVGILLGAATASRFRAITVVPVMALMTATLSFSNCSWRNALVAGATAAVSVQLGYFGRAILWFAVMQSACAKATETPRHSVVYSPGLYPEARAFIRACLSLVGAGLA
jgi:hypothetical protein